MACHSYLQLQVCAHACASPRLGSTHGPSVPLLGKKLGMTWLKFGFGLRARLGGGPAPSSDARALPPPLPSEARCLIWIAPSATPSMSPTRSQCVKPLRVKPLRVKPLRACLQRMPPVRVSGQEWRRAKARGSG